MNSKLMQLYNAHKHFLYTLIRYQLQELHI